MTTLSPRQKTLARERLILSCHATRSDEHGGRDREEPICEVRTEFQRDSHRVQHSKAFRRLRGKTQVFLWPKGDHYRTRLVHCLEVAQIGRTLARALDLNEDLTEAIALAHDLGHSPFGHAGEAALQKLVPGGFRHERQSLRVVEKLERDGAGLNLTRDVRDGILKHSKGQGPLLSLPDELLPASLEGQIVRLADIFAYVNHDLDDAMRAKVLRPQELPADILSMGATHSERLTNLVLDVLENTDLEIHRRIGMSDAAATRLEVLRDFLYRNVYYNENVHGEFHKAMNLIERLWEHFVSDVDRFYEEHWPTALRDGTPQDDIRDFLAGMTDAYAVEIYEQVFVPRRWFVL
ncbi:MAG: deoxyguanosinetriphosphate triphosphohydrolase [Myxococcota bacterium]|jgi:dGTPase|nr:deoxyguanosinetriphosphate triphosphohydrolase [Myxococcota bacterium]